jgi:ActR/RegA family two-component response regulator
VEFESKYLERLVLELSQARDQKRERLVSRTSIIGLESAFEKVKSACVEEVLRVKETNEDLAKYVETFSNNILTVLIDLKASEHDYLMKLDNHEEVLNEMISEAASKREAILIKMQEGLEREKEENISPTARMARAALPKKKVKKEKK